MSMNVDESSIQVLHVDDDASLLELSGMFLERESDRLTVTGVTSPEDGLTALESGDIDCIVSDYDMPELTGIEFLERVRERYPDLPFILFTGKGSEEVASEAISAGVSDYLQKGGTGDRYVLLANRIVSLVEKYQAEKARQRHNLLIQEATDAILVVGEDTTIRYASPSAESVMGRRPDELVGTVGFEYVHPDDQDRVVEAFAELVDLSEGFRTVEFRYEQPDGSWLWVEARGRNLSDRPVVDGIAVYARDISARKEWERTLQRQSRAMENAPVGITLTDPTREDNPLIYANEAFVELTGYQEAETLDRNCRFLQGSGTDPERVRQIREAIDEGRPAEVTLRNYRKDGTEFWNRLTIAPIRDDDGTLQNWVGFQSDVTEEKERRRSLQHERDRFRAVFEESFDPMVIADDDGRYVEVNEAATELFGLPETELVGRTVEEFLSEGFDLQAAWEQFQGSRTERGTVTLVRPDGEERVVEYAATANIVPGRHLSILRDVTDRRARERTLERYEQMVETMQEAACIYDEEGRIELANEYLAAFYGEPPEALKGRRSNLLPLVRAASEGDPYRELLDGDRSELHGEIAGEFPNAGHEILSYRITPLVSDGETEGAVAVAHEVTELERRGRTLERANQRLDDLAGILSHDLRSPLTVASAHLELAREECDSEHLDDVESAHDRMRTLVETLLTLAREGREAMDEQALSLEAVVTDCWQHVVTDDATLVVETDATVRADRQRLRQLFENLFRNAVEHGGSDVTVTVGDLPDGFYVADDGPGMPAESLEGSRPDSVAAENAGFGLSIVERVAESHGWEMAVADPGPGTGARFEFTGTTTDGP